MEEIAHVFNRLGVKKKLGTHDINYGNGNPRFLYADMRGGKRKRRNEPLEPTVNYLSAQINS